ncbi:MAG: DNA-binding protein [Methylotenera sp.]|jgi:gp16 family phage-associated protein|nr:MAG: DNA-binding protein [Methylotenera sp.]
MSDQILDTSAAKKLFETSGISVSEWSRVHGFSAILVYQVLDGQRKCRRGQSHQIAVALGLKQGMVIKIDELTRLLTASALPTGKKNQESE